jgi:hypothetical protein
MKRRVFDIIVSAGGALVVVALLAAGSLLMWGYTFANDNVHNELAAQQIYFPPKAAFEHAKPGTEITPSMIPSVSRFAGQQLLTGEQARVWANDFMAVHLREMPYHGIYSKVSEAARAHPESKELAALETTVFQGTTLRSLLLDAYAFSTIAEVMFVSSLVAFSLAFLMAILVGLGLWHARRTAPEEELLSTISRAAAGGGSAPHPAGA